MQETQVQEAVRALVVIGADGPLRLLLAELVDDVRGTRSHQLIEPTLTDRSEWDQASALATHLLAIAVEPMVAELARGSHPIPDDLRGKSPDNVAELLATVPNPEFYVDGLTAPASVDWCEAAWHQRRRETSIFRPLFVERGGKQLITQFRFAKLGQGIHQDAHFTRLRGLLHLSSVAWRGES